FKGKGHGVAELARRLGAAEAELRAVHPVYRSFHIAKRSGGTRLILAPDERLKALQRRIVRRLLRRLRCHAAATGFEHGRSIVANLGARAETRHRRYRNPRTGAPATPDVPDTHPIAAYTRYADDLTFSFAVDDPRAIRDLIYRAKRILRAEGYEPNGRKQRIHRRHARQLVTGLVVNEEVNLPRTTRRWLRAVRHHLEAGRPASLTPGQLAGWLSFWRM